MLNRLEEDTEHTVTVLVLIFQHMPGLILQRVHVPAADSKVKAL